MRVRVVGQIDVHHLGDWRRVRSCGWTVVFLLSEIGFVVMTCDLWLIAMMVLVVPLV